MAKNPLIRSFPRRINKPLPNKSAGILDDFAVRKVIATKEGSITRTPVNDIDIANKAYVDSVAGISNIEGGNSLSTFGGVINSPVDGGDST